MFPEIRNKVMKNLSLFVILFVYPFISFGQATIEFRSLGVEDALTSSRVEQKNIIVAFLASHLQESFDLEKTLESNPFNVDAVNTSLIPVSVDMDKPEDFDWFAKYKIVHVPILVILDPMGNEIDRLAGEITDQRLTVFLDNFKNVDATFINPSKEIERPAALVASDNDDAPVIAAFVSESVITKPKFSKNLIVQPKESRTVEATISNAVVNRQPTMSVPDNSQKLESTIVSTVMPSPSPTIVETTYTSQATELVYESPPSLSEYRMVTKTRAEHIRDAVNRAKKRTTTVVEPAPIKKNINYTANQPIDTDNYSVRFARYPSMAMANDKKQTLEKSIAKRLKVSESEEAYEVITSEFQSKEEAKEFVQEKRSKGISCFLFSH